MAILQPLIDLVEICHLHGVTQAVVSPGSRSAALTLALARNPRIQCTVVMDERSAGFIALGMAQQLGKTVVLVCTSGSAGYNFAPAVSEAFFQQIPLLVLTADRPNEWIHQNDGQTIYQAGLYGRHVKTSYELPADYDHPDVPWFINRSVNEALLTTMEKPSGPVHINVPIREPFYPRPEEELTPSPQVRIVERSEKRAVLTQSVWHSLMEEWEDTEKILIAVGQHGPDAALNSMLVKMTEEFQIPVIGEVLGNLSTHELSLKCIDLVLSGQDLKDLTPDLLITVGHSFVSKNFKKFIRENPPPNHWHVSEDKHVIDPFQTLTRQLNVGPEYFFSKIFEDLDYHRFVQNEEGGQDETYLEAWMSAERGVQSKITRFFENLSLFSDLSAVNFILQNLNAPAQLHIANSMPIRYVSMLGLDLTGISVHGNRGTSGIDGCLSTALGAAFVSNQTVYLLVGDVAFFYDRNGLLTADLPANLKIILLNNAGGTIFRMIEGPASQPELSKYFETRHNYTARRTAEDSGISYFTAATQEELQNHWPAFAESKKVSLLEIKTNPETDAAVFKQLKQEAGRKR